MITRRSISGVALALVALLGLAAPAQAWRHRHGPPCQRWHGGPVYRVDGDAVAWGIVGGVVGAIVLDRVLTPPAYAEPRRYADPYDSGYDDGYERGYRRGRSDRYHDGRNRGYDDGYAAGRGY